MLTQGAKMTTFQRPWGAPSFCATQACVGSNWLAAQDSESSLTCCSKSLWIRFCCSIHS